MTRLFGPILAPPLADRDDTDRGRQRETRRHKGREEERQRKRSSQKGRDREREAVTEGRGIDRQRRGLYRKDREGCGRQLERRS